MGMPRFTKKPAPLHRCSTGGPGFALAPRRARAGCQDGYFPASVFSPAEVQPEMPADICFTFLYPSFCAASAAAL